MFNKSDVETRHINIYKIEPSSLSIRVSVPVVACNEVKVIRYTT